MGGSHRTLRNGTGAIPKVMGTGTLGCQRGLTKKAPRFVSWTTDPSDFFPPRKSVRVERAVFFGGKNPVGFQVEWWKSVLRYLGMSKV